MGCRGRGRSPSLAPPPENPWPWAAAWSRVCSCRTAQSETLQSKRYRTDRRSAASQSFPDQSFTHKHMLVLPGKIASLPHAPHLQSAAVFRFRHARRIRTRRSRVHRARSFHIQRFVRTLLIVLAAKTIKSPLLCCARLAAGGEAVSCFSVRCIRSCRPFCSGCPAAIRSGTIPSFIHHTARRESPATARDANGAPLSVRIARGRPHSRNADSKIARTRSPSVFSTRWQRNRYRLQASVIVSGSIRSPSPVRNQPLKSAHHTRLGASANANGSRVRRSATPLLARNHQPFPRHHLADRARRRPPLLVLALALTRVSIFAAPNSCARAAAPAPPPRFPPAFGWGVVAEPGPGPAALPALLAGIAAASSNRSPA